MNIRYIKNKKEYSNFDTCEDYQIDVVKTENRTSVTLTAKCDLELVKAIELFPLKTNKKDLYFLNGYQSWTDTKEFKLADRLRNIKKSPHIISHMFAMHAYGDSHFYKYSIKKSHGYDLFYSKGENESFIYNLNFDVAYLIIEIIKDKRSTIRLISDLEGLKLKKGESVKIFDYY